MKTKYRGVYPYTEAEAKKDINEHYNNPNAWDIGVRSWHAGHVMPFAKIWIKSPRGNRYHFETAGSDETYMIKIDRAW